LIIDTSAIIAVLFDEDDAQAYAAAIADADICRISAGTFLEASLVVESLTKQGGSRQLDSLMRRAEMVVEPFTEEHAHVARQAFLDFGKGRHPASLNFGDCFAYALSKTLGEPLLFKGDDFSKTDLTSARAG
jgi:ribonuclease VapC